MRAGDGMTEREFAQGRADGGGETARQGGDARVGAAGEIAGSGSDRAAAGISPTPDFRGAADRVSLEEAAGFLLSHCQVIREMESVPLLDCPGRVLAEDVRAGFDNPPFDRSPVDGYAVRSADIDQASRENPAVLQVIGEVDAGGWSEDEVGPGQAMRIMTGAPIPRGADCCVYQEQTDYGEEKVQVYKPCDPWKNYCFKGEDIEAGALVLKEGTALTYVETGILAGLGREKVKVYRRTRVAVFASGDELAEPGTELAPGKIYDNNLYFLAARLRELEVEITALERVPDRPEVMAKRLVEACGQADLIITTGGVSVGKKDIMHEALALCGAQRLFWKIRMKPGMPTIGSVLGGTPVVSLSGNPFGALADCELLVRPMLAKAGHNPALNPGSCLAVMPQGFPKASPSRRFLRGICENGQVRIPEVKKHASGILSSMSGCNCLVDIPAGTEAVEPGEEVRVILL